MSPLRKFWRLPSGERRLLVGAVALVTVVRIGVSLWGFRRLRRALARLSRPRAAVPLPPERIEWAVRAAAQRVPGARSCLVQALAAEMLLARHGHVSQLRIGIARVDSGIAAHAWLERGGRPVFGQPGPAGNTVLPPLPPLEARNG
jgi:Transglutaminase-like superfamily